MEEDAWRGAPGGEPGRFPGTGGKAQGADAEGAVAERGVVRRRGVGRGRRGWTWAAGFRASRTRVHGGQRGVGYMLQGGVGWRGRHRKELVVAGRRGSMEKGTGKGTWRVKRWRQRRTASMAGGDKGMKVGTWTPRRRTGRRISGCRGWDSGVQERQQKRATVDNSESAPGTGAT